MERERLFESRPIGIAERFGEERALLRVARQLLRLAVVTVLQPMLYAAQEAVRGVECVAGPLRKRAAFREGRQCRACAADPKLGLLAAPNDLQRLCDELDFSNASGTELDVVRIAAAALLLANLPMDVAQS